MKKVKSPKEGGHKGLTPNKQKRRPGGGQPSPIKKFTVDCNYSNKKMK